MIGFLCRTIVASQVILVIYSGDLLHEMETTDNLGGCCVTCFGSYINQPQYEMAKTLSNFSD